MSHPLKIILWKELRENWKWAALGALALALGELYALYQQRNSGSYLEGGFGLCSPVFLIVSVCGSVLVGAALGALQIVPELDRDRWAALLHRPVSRSTLFFGKVIAGLLLYLAATGIPLLLSCICLAVPGEFPAPFVAGMIRPVVGNVFLGVPVYALAVLISLIRGRWYGRRTLLVLSILPLLVVVLNSPWMFLSSALVAAVALMAAWGTIAGNGTIRPGQKAAAISLGLLFFIGVEVELAFGAFLLAQFPGANSSTTSDFDSPSFLLMTEGKVLLNHTQSDSSGISLTEVDGSPVTDERYRGNDVGSHVGYFLEIAANLKSPEELHQSALPDDPHLLHNYARVVYGDIGTGTEYWYYLVGKDYFVGYDKLTRRQVGICDREGFHPAGSTPRPFSKPLQLPVRTYPPPLFGWLDGQIYHFDPADRALRPFYTAPSGRIHTIKPVHTGRKMIYYAVVLDGSIQILDLEGKPLVTIPYGHDKAARAEISIGTVPSGERVFVQYQPSKTFVEEPGKPSPLSYVDEIDLQGNVLHTYSAVTRAAPRSESGWLENLASVGVPFVPATIITLVIHHEKQSPEIQMGDSAFGLILDDSTRKLLLSCGVLALLAAAVAFRWARRAGLSRGEVLSWVAFVFCLGIPGLIAFRLAAPFPIRITCPSCSRKRSIETEQCPSCHQDWPAPASNGTEIFAESGC